MTNESDTFGEASAPRSALLLGAMLATFVALCVAATALPHDRYIRYQQLEQTIQYPMLWGYQRVHFDPTPIDIAIVGPSRAEAALSGPDLTHRLSADLGRPVNVANLSFPQEGRNAMYAVAKDLLDTRPEVRLLILTVGEQMPRMTHPAFRNVAETRDVLGAPALINYSYLTDIAYLPWRQLSLSVQSAFPALFGDDPRFAASDYRGTMFDSTHSQHEPNGRYIDRDSIVPQPELARQAKARFGELAPHRLPPSLVDTEFAVERSYTRKIAALAEAHGSRVMFIYLPIYSGPEAIDDEAWYRTMGPVVKATFIARDSTLYSDYGHANRRGSARVTRWFGSIVEAMIRGGAVRLADPAPFGSATR